MIDFDTVELIALVNATSHYRKLSKRTVDQDRALDQCAWRMKVEIQREKTNREFERDCSMRECPFHKERLDHIARFARMCYRRNLSPRGDDIDDLAERLVTKILSADHARNQL